MVILLVGCEKRISRTTEVSGVVLDYGTKEPIEGVKIHLKDGFDGSSLLGNADYTTDAESIVYTDSDGKFDVELKGEYSAFLYPSHFEYWGFDDGHSITSGANFYKKGSKTTDEVIELKAQAWFGGVFSFMNAVDSVIFGITFHHETGLPLKSFGVIYPIDTWDNNIINLKDNERIAIGNTYFKFCVWQKYDNIWHEKIDSVYIEKGEIYRDTIYY